MTDPFAIYAEQAIPTAQQRRQAKEQKPASALDLKMEERQRLSRAYRVWKRQETQTVLASEPRLSRFLRYLRTVTAETGSELIDAIVASDWLLHAPEMVRVFALRMIAARCDRINRLMGNEALDDPLPPESNVYFDARALLLPGGRA